MPLLSRDVTTPTEEDFSQFSALVNEILSVRRHIDLMKWLQGSLQQYLPHDILIAAWGDFHLGLIHYDVVSSMPGVRSESAVAESIAPLLTGLFDRWITQDRAPFTINVNETGFTWESAAMQGPIAEAMSSMRSSLVHGINDQRGRHDCLYVFFSKFPKRRRNESNAVKILLPYIDSTLRQVELLPNQYASPAVVEVDTSAVSDNGPLSDREAEIMKWVAMGKTNGEIGSILNVSSFTIKNHMQRIFKKLDVFNRAQAVSNFKRHYNTQSDAARKLSQDA
ncbi:MAG: transcriptional regulator EpsA [Burkholderiaceae bacterium]|nr:transcriptional regulator EpsA [Burkholderiaceae bacterium]